MILLGRTAYSGALLRLTANMAQSTALFHPAATMQGGARTSAIAADIVSWLIAHGQASSRADAVDVCSRLQDAGLLLSCVGAPRFVDAFSSYFVPPPKPQSPRTSRQRGATAIKLFIEFIALSCPQLRNLTCQRILTLAAHSPSR